MKRYIILIIITVIVGSLPLFIQYGDYVLMDDYFRQEIPFIMETKRMFSSGFPFWSWNTFFGDNFIGGYGFYTLTSPFVWLNCLFPYSWLLKTLFLTLILKYICAFLTARMFLRKMSVSVEASSIGGLLYAFSSYAISNSFYYHFFEPMIVFPLLLLAIERFLKKEAYCKVTLMLASFLVVFINYYFAVCSFVAAAMYVFCRVLFSGKLKQYLSRVPLGILLILAGILLDGALLVPTALHLVGGARASQGILTGLDFTAVPFFVERLRTLFMPQVIEEKTTLYQGTGFNSCSVTLPVVGIFLVILYYWENKKSWITALVLVSLIAFLTPLNTVFSLFTNPNYTRWAYALSLFLTLATVKWMDAHRDKKQISYKILVGYSIVALGVFVFSVLRGDGLQEKVNQWQFAFYLFVLIVSLACLSTYVISKKSYKSLRYGILICASLQMICFHILRSDVGFSLVDDKDRADIVRPYLLDNKLLRKDCDASMLYRTAFESRYPNLGLLMNRPSVSTFHSVLNTNLYKITTITDSNHVEFSNTFVPKDYKRSFYALMSVKEKIEYNDQGYKVVENKDYIPVGFTYDTYLTEDVLDSMLNDSDKPDVPYAMLSHLVVPKEKEHIFVKYLKRGNLVVEPCNMDSVVTERRKNASDRFIGNTQGFISDITLTRDNFVFYSVPADKGFTAYVDGKQSVLHKVNLGLSAVLVPKGKHEVQFLFVPAGMKGGMMASAAMMVVLLLVGWDERLKLKKEI